MEAYLLYMYVGAPAYQGLFPCPLLMLHQVLHDCCTLHFTHDCDIRLHSSLRTLFHILVCISANKRKNGVCAWLYTLRVSPSSWCTSSATWAVEARECKLHKYPALPTFITSLKAATFYARQAVLSPDIYFSNPPTSLEPEYLSTVNRL